MEDNQNYNSNDELKKSISGELAAYMNKQSKGDQIIESGAQVTPENAGQTSSTVSDALKSIEDKAVEKPKPIVRTYQSDMQETIQEGHLSSINIAVSQNNKMLKKSNLADVEKKKKKINKNIIIISTILIVGGVLAFSVPYLVVKKQSAPAQTVQQVTNFSPTDILTPDLEEQINIADINLTNLGVTLEQRINQSSTSLGQVKDFVLTTGTSSAARPLTSTEFFTLLGITLPDQIQRTIEPEYMFGMHNFNGNQKFLILKVGEYDTAFAGMLSWEETLWQNFTDVFGLQNTTNSQPSSTDTTSAFSVTVQTFQDATFSNKDCRIVKDANGNIVFLYSIVDSNTIVITTSPDTLKEILLRMNKARVSTQ